MGARKKRATKAMKAAVIYYGSVCIITCTPTPDPAHIYPQGRFPEMAALEFNIYPLNRKDHIEMDKLTNPSARIKWLEKKLREAEFNAEYPAIKVVAFHNIARLKKYAKENNKC